ncbi:MAG: phosphatidylinositol-specific phospholipase C domain-containing protein [Lentisphaeria bacterium]|nr:phosphatidylinositol-specific phospholipase C domain-containing protein [Lentisphaeria bacterium]
MKRKSSVGKVILFVCLGILAALLLAFILLMYLLPVFERVDPTPVDGSSAWMSRLDDNLPLSQIVLPGTHDSASNDVQLAFFSKCQDLTIEEQLEAGYRYLDIRLELDGETFKLMHGFTACKTSGWPFSGTLYLDTVLEQCYQFLDGHPSECILFAVKKEHGDASVETFETVLNDVISKNASYWLLTDQLPTVREARGKLVLLRRYSDPASLGEKSGISFQWASQDNRTDTSKHIVAEQNDAYTLWVQDRFKYDSQDKWSAFVNGLNDALANSADVAVHFLSTNGSSSYGHPYKYATILNEQLMTEDIAVNGWVIVDFASSNMAYRIYSQNFRN